MKRTAEHNAKIAKSIKRHYLAVQNARAVAREAGEKFFVPETPCKRGHRLKYVNDGWCVECARLEGRRPDLKFKRIFQNAKGRAKQEHLPFDLTEEYIKQIWPPDNLCPVMKTPLVEPSGPFRRGPRSFSPSVDRIKPERGYVKGNVAIISHYANTLKNDCCDPAVFRRLADWLEKVKYPMYNIEG